MQRPRENSFFAFLPGKFLNSISNVVVSVPDATWSLSDTLVFSLKSGGLLQLIVDMGSQRMVDIKANDDLQISGDYDDLIESHLNPIEIPGGSLPDRVTSVAEFSDSAGKVVGAEIHLVQGAFSILLYPEDADIRSAGAVWEFVREHGLSQLGEIHVRWLHVDF